MILFVRLCSVHIHTVLHWNLHRLVIDQIWCDTIYIQSCGTACESNNKNNDSAKEITIRRKKTETKDTRQLTLCT